MAACDGIYMNHVISFLHDRLQAHATYTSFVIWTRLDICKRLPVQSQPHHNDCTFTAPTFKTGLSHLSDSAPDCWLTPIIIRSLCQFRFYLLNSYTAWLFLLLKPIAATRVSNTRHHRMSVCITSKKLTLKSMLCWVLYSLVVHCTALSVAYQNGRLILEYICLL